ncbi:MAG: PQQ-binding-like beta-propeller repeat protein [Thermoplasmatota archaeon]
MGKVLPYSILSILILMLPVTAGSEGSGPLITSAIADPDPAWNPPADSFPMFRGDPENKGNVSVDGPESCRLRATITEGGYCSPVIEYDKLYYCSSRAVFCFDMNGNRIWRYATGEIHWNTPLVYKGRVYVAGDSGELWCLSANATGQGTTTLHWKFTPTDPVSMCASSPTTDGKRIYYNFGTVRNGMMAVWIANGSQAWNASLGMSTVVESSPSYWEGKVYTGAGDSYAAGSDYVYCFNANTGSLIWKFDAGDAVCSSPAVEYGRVYFGGTSRNVFCLDARGNGDGTTTEYWRYTTTRAISSSPAVAYGRVYIGDQNSNAYVYCLDAFGSGGTTTRYWWVSTGTNNVHGVCSSPVVTPSYIYVGNTANRFLCLNRSTGLSVWSRDFEGGTYGISSSPAVVRGFVAFASDNGELYIVEPKTDYASPVVTATYPSDDETNVPLDVNITVWFNETMDRNTIDNTSIHLDTVSGRIDTDVGHSGIDNSAWIKPKGDLSKETRYLLTVETTVTDNSSNPLDGDADGMQEGDRDTFFMDFWTIPFSKPVIDLEYLRAREDVEKRIDLREHISDEDTPFVDLVITENSTYCDIDEHELVMLYPQGVTKDIVNISVSDGRNTVFGEVSVNITSENDAPTIDPLSPINPVEDIDLVLDLTNKVRDQDGDVLEINTSSDHASVEGLKVTFNYPDGVLRENVIISVSDGLESDWTILNVTVTPVNDPPVIHRIGDHTGEYVDVEIKEDAAFVLLVEADDIDGPWVGLELEEELPRLTLSNHTGELRYEPVQEDVGIHPVRIFAFDSVDRVLRDSVSLNITVVNVNDAPISMPIHLKSMDDENLTVILNTSVAFDEDSDRLTYEWEFGDGSTILNEILVTHIYDAPGNYTVRLTVSDGNFTSVQTYRILLKGPITIPDDDDDDDVIIDDDDIDDDIGPDPDDDAAGESNENGLDPFLLVVLVILILLIIGAVIGVVFIFTRPKEVEWEEDEMADPDLFMARYQRLYHREE